MIIASWNINSVRARLEILQSWLQSVQPDVLLLQELKCQDEQFPLLEIQNLGYQAIISGQKAYNGVAILSKHPIVELSRSLIPDDPQARFLAAEIQGVHMVTIYAPNGNPLGTEKFPYKLSWLAALEEYAKMALRKATPFFIAGDYNIIPTPLDVYNPKAFLGDALFQPESIDKYRRLVNLGLYDAYRALYPNEQAYTFWDYQAGCWPNNQGLRIDHFLLNAEAMDRLQRCWIDREPRALEKASDHTPILIEL